MREKGIRVHIKKSGSSLFLVLKEYPLFNKMNFLKAFKPAGKRGDRVKSVDKRNATCASLEGRGTVGGTKFSP